MSTANASLSKLIEEANTPKQKVSWEIPDDEVHWPELHERWDKENPDDDVIGIIQRGRTGYNEGLDNGLVHVNRYIHGTHRARYILIGADSGVGKTTIADFMYVYKLWLDARRRKIKLNVLYFSFEISKAEKKLRWICQWIYHIYKEDLSPDYIAGRIPGMRITDEHMKMVMRAYGVVEEVMQNIKIVDHMLHPTGMFNAIIEHHYEKIGTVHRKDPTEKHKKGMITGYKPDDPNEMTVIIVDHLALINQEKGAFQTKDIMDRWSLYSVQLRNIFGATLIQVQQFNTNQMSAYREQKRSEAAIAPQRLDFGDSTYTYRDADLVFGLVKPVLFNLKTYYGYNLEELGQYFLALHLMKNRYGPASRTLPLFINPVAGMFYDLPIDQNERFSDGTLAMDVFKTQAQRLEKICQQYNYQPGAHR